MFGSVILEVAIGLSMIYLVMSLIATTLMELISQVMDLRAKNLKEGLKNIFHNDGHEVLSKFYKHPLIYGLYKGNDGKPGYIPGETFAKTVVDLLRTGDESLQSAVKLREDLKQNNTEIARAILALIDPLDTGINNTMKNIAVWYDNSMDRVSGWYKKKTQTIILIISAIVVSLLNVDSIKIANVLASRHEVRMALVAIAQNTTKECKDANCINAGVELKKMESTAFFPIGLQEYENEWNDCPDNYFYYIIMKIMGLAATVFSISLGAPFWFDLLNKIVNIRNAGVKPLTESEK